MKVLLGGLLQNKQKVNRCQTKKKKNICLIRQIIFAFKQTPFLLDMMNRSLEIIFFNKDGLFRKYYKSI